MPHNILMSKIRCDSPNKKGTASHNRNHLIYIATREGTDLTLLEDEISSKFEKEMASSKDYVKYIHDRPRSHGLFGNLPPSEINDIKVISKTVYNVSKKQNIYRGIVSLDPRDAEELGYYDKEKWNTYLKSIMPDIAKQFDIPIDKLKWVAAYHSEAGHPHVHYMFWSDAPMVKNPFIHTSVQNKCREILSGKMFEDERHNEVIDKTISRDLITEFGKNIVEKDIDLIRSVTPGIVHPKIPGKVPFDCLSRTSEEIIKLLPMLPGHGSLKYQYMPPEVKKQLSVITQTILLNKKICAEYDKYMDNVTSIFMTYSPAVRKRTAGHPQTNAIEDLNKRLGNIILKGIKPLLPLLNNADALSGFIGTNDDDRLPDLPNQKLFDKAVSLATWDKTAQNNYRAKKAAVKTEALLPDDSGFLNTEPENNNTKEILSSQVCEQTTENGDPAFDYTLTMYDAPDEEYYNIDDVPTEYLYDGLSDTFVQEESSSVPNYSSVSESEVNIEHPEKLNPHNSPALDYYNHSFEKADKFESYKLGKMFSNSNSNIYDLDKAISCFKKSASLGSQAAQFSLGRIYSSNHYGRLDIPAAVEYLNSAAQKRGSSANRSNDMALYQLGRIFSNKEFEVYDLDKAESYLRESATLGNQFAQLSLGRIYSSNHYGKLDIPAAIEFLNSAAQKRGSSANHGNDMALYQLGRIFSSKEFGVYDLDKAESYLRESATLGNQFAQLSLGRIYSSNHYGKLDIPLALEYLSKAAEKGNEWIFYQLGKIFSDPHSKIFDLDRAISYFNNSAESGSLFAKYSLGVIYSSPDSAKFNISLALKNLNEAAEKNNDFALLKLGNMYLWGKGVSQNIEKGKDYLNQALELGNPYAQNCLNLYETIRLQYAVNCSFRIFQDFFNALSYNNDRAAAAIAARQFDLSKKAIREEQLKNPHKHTGNINLDNLD